MKPKKQQFRIIQPKQNSKEWHLYNQIGRFVEKLDILPTAAEARKTKKRSAPLQMGDLVF